ncbi:MAG: hypothetical protein LH603_01045 [Pseudonocardia sp.]|nr:hypothetical protein [Pseudonocardia sp.]
MKAAGVRWFLTQKLSWNETNVAPHHTFLREGIDGTRIFTHFPPVDTYGAELSGAQRQYAEEGRANTSLVPFGWSDGGGGPTREMLVGGRLALRPFQIVTLRFARGPAEPPVPRSPSGSAGGPRGTGGVSSRAATRTAPSHW